jgi:hypothetical protein
MYFFGCSNGPINFVVFLTMEGTTQKYNSMFYLHDGTIVGHYSRNFNLAYKTYLSYFNNGWEPLTQNELRIITAQNGMLLNIHKKNNLWWFVGIPIMCIILHRLYVHII